MAQTDRNAGLVAEAAFKNPVRAATTANITLSGEQTVDGVALVADDRCLVKDQTDGTENGIYDVSTGAWTRSKDFNGAYDAVTGTVVWSHSGTTNGQQFFHLTTSDTVDIGTDTITWASGFPSTVTSSQVTANSGDTARTLANMADDRNNVKAHGAVVDGATDDSAKLQAAIDAGIGNVYHDNGNMAIASTVTLASSVKIIMGEGATITWTGAAGGTMFDTPVTDVLLRTGIVGGKIDTQDAGIFLDAHSIWFSEFGDFEMTGERTTSTVFRLSADSTAGASPTGGARHFSRNHFHDIRYAGGSAGTFFHCRLNNAASQRFFGNTFGNLDCDEVNTIGYKLEGVDNCIFYGHIRCELEADSTKGITFEQDTTASVETEENVFQYVDVDSFVNLPGTNRVGVSFEDAADKNIITKLVIGGTGITDDVTIGASVKGFSIFDTSGPAAADTKPTIRKSGSGEVLVLERTGGTCHQVIYNSSGGTGELGRIIFRADDDGGTATDFARILTTVDDDTNTSEDVTLQIDGFVAGNNRTLLKTGASGYISAGDGITAPSTVSGLAFIYVDTADGDLKVKFGDGTVRKITDDAAAQTYTPSNVTTTRTYDADASSVAELADVLGTLIADLQARGSIS